MGLGGIIYSIINNLFNNDEILVYLLRHLSIMHINPLIKAGCNSCEWCRSKAHTTQVIIYQYAVMKWYHIWYEHKGISLSLGLNFRPWLLSHCKLATPGGEQITLCSTYRRNEELRCSVLLSREQIISASGKEYHQLVVISRFDLQLPHLPQTIAC